MIAMPDLDYFKSVAKGTDLSAQVGTVVRFYPYHMEIIMEEAKKFYPFIEGQRPALERIRDNSIDFYTKVYKDRLGHIQRHGITALNPVDFAHVPMNVKKAIQEVVIEKALELHRGKDDETRDKFFFRNFLNEDPIKMQLENIEKGSPEYYKEIDRFFKDFSREHSPQAISNFKEKIPELIDLATNFIRAKLKEKFDKLEGPIGTTEELVAFRTFSYRTDRPDYEAFVQTISEAGNFDDEAAKRVINMIFQGLRDHGHLSYFIARRSNAPLIQVFAC
jgi:hypothetical protein